VQLALFIRARTKSSVGQTLALKANDLIWTLVKEADQVIVAGLKAALADDGKVSPEELAKVKKDVVEKFKSLWGPFGMQLLAEAVGVDGAAAAETWVNSKVEAAVHDLKATPVPTPAPT
jgi:hypothetical protein